MKLEKQDVGVWVKASIMPEESGFYLAKRIDDSVSKMRFDRQREVWVNYRGNIVEWLKPIEQVYVLTETELTNIKMQEWAKGHQKGYEDLRVQTHTDSDYDQ